MATTRNIRKAILEVGEKHQFDQDLASKLDIVEALVDGQVMGFAESMREMRDSIEEAVKLSPEVRDEFREDFKNKAVVIVARALAHWLDKNDPPGTPETVPPPNVTEFIPRKKPGAKD